MPVSQKKNIVGPVTIGTQSASTVVLGPVTIESGIADIQMYIKTAAGGCTTPTAYTLQMMGDLSNSVAFTTSTTATASASGNAVVASTKAQFLGNACQVISGAAFAAGTAQLYLVISEPA